MGEMEKEGERAVWGLWRVWRDCEGGHEVQSQQTLGQIQLTANRQTT